MLSGGRRSFALLLLRSGLAGHLLFRDPNPWTALLAVHGALVARVCALTLLIGLWTPLIAGLCCLAALWTLLLEANRLPPLMLIAALNAAGVALAGAGMYSCDGLLYGRRRIIASTTLRP